MSSQISVTPTIQHIRSSLRATSARTALWTQRRTFKLQTPLGEGLTMANRAALLKKIQARKAEKQAAAKAKWAAMRHTAVEGAAEFEKKLACLSELCAAAADGFDNLRENLDLVTAPKEASLKVRVATARNYAKSFQRIAEEAPEQIAEAVQEAYKSLDEIAGTLELAAEQLGVDLNATPVEEAF